MPVRLSVVVPVAPVDVVDSVVVLAKDIVPALTDVCAIGVFVDPRVVCFVADVGVVLVAELVDAGSEDVSRVVSVVSASVVCTGVVVVDIEAEEPGIVVDSSVVEAVVVEPCTDVVAG